MRASLGHKPVILVPGMDARTIRTGVEDVFIVSVDECPPEECNRDPDHASLVRVTFNKPVSNCKKWNYRNTGEEYWNNPCFPRELSICSIEEMEKAMTSNLYRSLSAVFLVNSAAFAKASPLEQTEALTKTEGKIVLFVDNFASLSNTRKLRDRLLAGEDVSMELEFNGIELSASERATLDAVRPLLERITGIKGNYPWLEAASEDVVKRAVVFGATSITINGYNVGVATGKAIFEKASRFWSGGKKPPEFNRSIGGRNRYVNITADYVEVGCQKCNRNIVEAIAQHYGWEPVINEG